MFDLLDFYDNIVSYFQSDGFKRIFLAMKLVSFGISSLFIFAIIILLSRSRATWWVAERFDSFRKAKLPERMINDWEKIQARLQKQDEANLKLAVIEADNLADEVLKRMGLAGKDMGERLEKVGKEQIKSIGELLEAHRLRDLIVHQPSIFITKEQAERAVKGYEAVLKELEIL
jgi:hypothetical protein